MQLFHTDLCLPQTFLLSKLNAFPAPPHRNWETSWSFSVTNRAMRVLLGSPSTTSYLLTMDITPTCLFLSPSLHFWRRPCSKCFSKTQPCHAGQSLVIVEPWLTKRLSPQLWQAQPCPARILSEYSHKWAFPSPLLWLSHPSLPIPCIKHKLLVFTFKALQR